MNPDGCGSSGGSEVVRFRNSGAAGVPVHDGAGVTPHRWLKATFAKLNLVKATFSHHRTAPEDTRVTPVTSALPNLAAQKSHTPSAIVLDHGDRVPDHRAVQIATGAERDPIGLAHPGLIGRPGHQLVGARLGWPPGDLPTQPPR